MSEESYTLSEGFEADGQAGGAPLALDFKRLIALRLPLMILVAVLLGVPGAIVGWYTAPVQYIAVSDFKVLKNAPRVIDSGGQNQSSSAYESFVSTQTEQLRSVTIIRKALESPSLGDLSTYKSFANGMDPVVVLQKAISADRRGYSEIIGVECAMEDPEEARVVLGAVLAAYMRSVSEEQETLETGRLALLEQEEATQNEKLQGKKVKIQDLESKVNQAFLGADSAKVVRLSQLSNEIRETKARLDLLEAAKRQQQKEVETIAGLAEQNAADPDAPIMNMGVERRVDADPEVMAYRNLLLSAQTDFNALKGSLREAHPRYKDAKEVVDRREKEMARLKREARAKVIADLGANADRALDLATKEAEIAGKAKEELEDLHHGLETELADERKDTADAQAELEQLKMDRDQILADLKLVQNQKEEILREKHAPARVTWYSEPRVLGEPSNRKRILMVLVALFGAGCCGVAAGVARELTDRQLRSSRDVAKLTRIPVIASIPHVGEDDFLQAAAVPLLTMDHPNSMAADEYRRVLSRLLYPPEDTTEVGSLLIVSPSSGDGKTSLACNLSMALSQAHRRVLLVDISAQQSAVESCFELAPGVGLAELLRDEASPEESLRRTRYEGLFVMGPGMRTSDLASRLASRRMTDFLEWAEQQFDHVVIDSPPSLLMSDAKLLAPLTDGVLVVIGAGVSSMGMARRCLSEMEQLKANVVGVVLNGIRGMRGGYLGERRRQFYAYYQGAGNGENGEPLPEMQVVGEDDAYAEGDDGMVADVVLLPAEDEDERSRGR